MKYTLIGGCGRSGTTLVRIILDSHSNMACGPETKYFGHQLAVVSSLVNSYPKLYEECWNLKVEDLLKLQGLVCRAFMNKMAEAYKVDHICEKTPQNCENIAAIHRMMPEARFIYCYRDPRAVISSLLGQKWYNPATGKRAEYTQKIPAAIEYWNSVQEIYWDNVEKSPNLEHFEIKYEDLVLRTESIVKQVCGFLCEPFDEQMLAHTSIKHDLKHTPCNYEAVQKPIYTKSLDKYKDILSPDQIKEIEDNCKEWMEKYGYK